MKFISLLPALALVASALPSAKAPDWEPPVPPFTCLAAPVAPSLLSSLAAQLSPNATLLLPTSPLMHNTHLRWQAYAKPTYSVLIEVANEEDVVATVPSLFPASSPLKLTLTPQIRFANTHSLPFLAVDGAHGQTTALAKMSHGIAISFVRMKSVELLPGEDLARLGPGLTNGDLVRALWKMGKMTCMHKLSLSFFSEARLTMAVFQQPAAACAPASQASRSAADTATFKGCGAGRGIRWWKRAWFSRTERR